MYTIPYTTLPAPSKYNLAVFLLNFKHREDGLPLREAFEKDFQIKVPDHAITSEDFLHYIMSLR